MNCAFPIPATVPRTAGARRGSVLIIVLWIAFGLVSVALYFAHSMTYELRASDNRVATLEAEQGIEGASRYVTRLLTDLATNGVVPDLAAYPSEAVAVGEARFWLIGRSDRPGSATDPAYDLVDESSKLNLNTATVEMLQLLPGMPPTLAAAIVDWRDTNDTVTPNGAESETYQRLQPAYRCKNAPFETIDELRLVFGATVQLLRGEDANLNGVLDSNENDGDASPPIDDRNGQLDPGLQDYLTVYTRQPNTARTNLNNTAQRAALLQQVFGTERANQLLAQLSGRPAGATFRSALEFQTASRMTADEFARIETQVTVATGSQVEGLINVNTASAIVLACVPGISPDTAAALVSYRRANRDKLSSVAWVAEVLDAAAILQAGPYLTARSYQFTADIAAVGHHARGYSRTRFVFDTSSGAPVIRHRQDLTRLGWALGPAARRQLLLAKEKS